MTATNALTLWPLHVRSSTLAAQRENVVYRVEAEEGAFALRLHRPGFRAREELVSELEWMAELSRQGIAVPRPIASRAGRFIEEVDGQFISVLTWLAGEPLGKTGTRLERADPRSDFKALGRTLAQLHLASDRWTPSSGFTRWRWDAAGLVGERPVWGRFWDVPGLDDGTRRLFADVRAEALRFFREQGASLDFGLIHADAVRENVLMREGEAHLIDFDDAGWGLRLFDIATALVKNLNEPDYANLEAALLSGYRKLRVLDTTALPLILTLRALTYVGWIAKRMNEPNAQARRDRNIAAATTLARNLIQPDATGR